MLDYTKILKTDEDYRRAHLNRLKTEEEYLADGFEPYELWLIRKCDKMFNRFEELTEKQKERYFIMAKFLRL